MWSKESFYTNRISRNSLDPKMLMGGWDTLYIQRGRHYSEQGPAYRQGATDVRLSGLDIFLKEPRIVGTCVVHVDQQSFQRLPRTPWWDILNQPGHININEERCIVRPPFWNIKKTVDFVNWSKDRNQALFCIIFLFDSMRKVIMQRHPDRVTGIIQEESWFITSDNPFIWSSETFERGGEVYSHSRCLLQHCSSPNWVESAHLTIWSMVIGHWSFFIAQCVMWSQHQGECLNCHWNEENGAHHPSEWFWCLYHKPNKNWEQRI
jgi:hypothetical protein